MSAYFRARVACVGNEQDMHRLLCTLLDNTGYLDIPDDRPPYTLSELLDQVSLHAREDGGANDTFLYSMISRHRYGTAEDGTCHLQLTQHPCGLYTALFRYDSADPFQVHEWLELHRRTGRLLTVAQRASSDFTLDKGEIIFTAGQVLDNWDSMCECWLWLMDQYGCGLPPAEAASHFRKVQAILTREEYDQSIQSLLISCRNNLEGLAYNVSDQEGMREAMDACLVRRDFVHLSEYHYAMAESVLWETEHNHKWFATLDSVIPLLEKNA